MPVDDYSTRHPSTPWPLFSAMMIIAIVVGLAVWGTGLFRGPREGKHGPLHDPNVQLRAVKEASPAVGEERRRIEVIRGVKNSVVNVDTLAIQRNGYDLTLIERQQGTGSGFVWDTKGRIVTNFHVIRDTLALNRDGNVIIKPNATIRVTMADRTQWNATLVGIAPDSDLAVLRIDAPSEKLVPVELGRSSTLEVGQDVIAIGNPFGQSLSVSRGIISALDRAIQSVTDHPITGVIQTDAAMNPGNSGGPLLDRDGLLIGVNTAITSPTGGSVGIGYAIPVDTVNPVVTELIRNGREPSRPVLGIVALEERYTRELGHPKGVMIREVRPNGPAAKAGLMGLRRNANGRWEAGDLILSIEEQPIDTFADMDRILRTLKVGQSIRLLIERAGQQREVVVRLEGV